MDLIIVLLFTAPMALAALGELVGQKAGVINIGLEGTMLTGAFFAMLAAHSTGNPWLGLAAGTFAGVCLTVIGGIFSVGLAADQVVVGTAINLLSMGLTSFLFRSKFGSSGQLLSLPPLPNVARIDVVTVILVGSVPLILWLLQKTRFGLVLRAAGEYPKAVEAAGFSVVEVRLLAVAISGMFGGLAGAYLSLGVAQSFAENMTSGRGFIAIAMVTFGRWRPLYVFCACLLVGFLEALQFRFQSLGIQIPFQLVLAMPYIVALLVLAIVGKGTVAPSALARPYSKE
ncbi:MAG: ABC transporter permease [Fimbriimonadaceae bacterium]|nr:ABC transporter permease [Fimbriimonadaceae bacterium]